MADKRITDLPLISSGNVSQNDVLPIVDVAQDITNKIEVSQLKSYILSGVTNFIDVTYSELSSKIENSTLIEGQWYRLTDYKSTNFVYGFDNAERFMRSDYNNTLLNDFLVKYGFEFNGVETYESDVEVLLLQAVSSNEIAKIGYSETYPSDIIEYNPKVNSLGINTQIYNSSNLFLPTPITISGFDLQWDGTNMYFDLPTGYKIEDGDFISITFNLTDLSLGWDDFYGSYLVKYNEILPPFEISDYNNEINTNIKIINNGQRVIILDIPNILSIYSTNSLNLKFSYKITEINGLIIKRIDTTRNVETPFDFRNQRFRRFETTKPFFGQVTQVDFSESLNLPIIGYANQSKIFNQVTTDGIGSAFSIRVDFDSSGNFLDYTIINIGINYRSDDLITTDDLGFGSLILKVTSASEGPSTDVNYKNKFLMIADPYTQSSIFYDFTQFNGINLTGEYKDVEVFQEYVKNPYMFFNVLWNSTYPNVNQKIISFDSDNNTFIICKDSNITNASQNTIRALVFSNIKNFSHNFVDIEISYTNIQSSCYDNIINFINYCEIYNYCYFNIINNIQQSKINRIENNNICDIIECEILSSFNNNVIGNVFYNNKINGLFSGNLISTGFQSNTINDFFGQNEIGKFTNSNIFYFFRNNSIGNNFYSNNIKNVFRENTVLDNFNNNNIFKSFIENSIGNDFNSNNIFKSFIENSIGNDFNSNNINSVFQVNTILDNFNNNNFKNLTTLNEDFSLATHVYGNYNCDIFTNSGGVNKLSYYNASNVLTIKDITE